MKNLKSTTLENCEEFVSLTRRTRNLKRPSRMLARNGKHQWLPLGLARSARTISIVGTTINPIKSNQNSRVFWKPVNAACGRIFTESTWRPSCRKRRQFNAALQFGSQIYFYAWSNKRNGKKWRKFRRGTWRKSEVRKRWSMKGRTAQKFISPHWWTGVIWKMQNLRQSTKNAKVELYSEVIL